MIIHNNHNSGLTSVYLGSRNIAKVYSGSHLVFPITSPTPTGGTKFYATYNDDTSFSAECDGDSVLETGTTKQGGYSKYSGMTSAVIGNCIDTIWTSCFEGCGSLTSVTIPSSVTRIMGGAFQYCFSLTSVGVVGSGASIEIPNGVTGIGAYDQYGGYDGNVFENCSGLTDVVLGDQIEGIGAGAFGHCTSLRNVTIGSGLTSLGASSFGTCPNLVSVVIKATTPPTPSSVSNWNPFYGSTCPIYVEDESLNAFKTASGWSQYADRLKPLSEKP